MGYSMTLEHQKHRAMLRSLEFFSSTPPFSREDRGAVNGINN